MTKRVFRPRSTPAASAFVLISCLPWSAAFAEDLRLAQRDSGASQLQFSSETKSFDIPPGELAAALLRLKQEMGIAISFDLASVRDRHTQGLSGNYSVEQALRLLLVGTGLSYRVTADGTIAIEARDADPALVMPEIVVRSTFDEMDERQSLSAAKIIIGSSEIEKFGDVSMGEVIRRMPSVSFGGPPGENNDARLRGLHKDYTQILLDGRPVTGREFAIDQLPASQVERIEIIRTPTADMDAQGIAGAVNIVLKKIPTERTVTWKLGAGVMPEAPDDGKMGNAAFSYGESGSRFGYTVNGSLQNRFGVRTKDRRDYDGADLDTLKNREQDFEVREHVEYSLGSRLKWTPSSRNTFRIDPKLFYSEEDKDRNRHKKANLADQEFMNAVKVRQHAGADLEWQHRPDADTRYKLGTEIQYKDERKDQQDYKGRRGDAVQDLSFAAGALDRTYEHGISTRGSGLWVIGGKHSLESGVEWTLSDWDQTKRAWKRLDESDRSERRAEVREHKYAVYIQDEYIYSPKTVITPGLRLEYVQGRSNYDGVERELADHLHVGPSLHGLHNLTETTNLRASVTRSIRRPKYDDLVPFSEIKSGSEDDPDKVGNPQLKPETALGVETSVERYFAEKRGVASLNLFYRHLTDLVEKETRFNSGNDRWEQHPVNIDSGELWGAELDGSRKLDDAGLRGLTLRGNYSWLASSTRDRITGEKRRINEQPSYILNLGFDYEHQPWRSSIGVNYNRVGPMQKHDIVGANRRVQGQEPSHYLDLYLAHRVNKRLNVRLSAVNLLEIEKNRPRHTYDAAGNLVFFEQEDEASARSFFLTLEGKL